MNFTMDFKKSLDLILSVEDRLDVTRFLWQGIHVWPMVRRQLWFSQLRDAPERFYRHPDEPLELRNIRLTTESAQALDAVSGRYRGLFLTRIGDSVQDGSGKYFNRFADPFIQSFEATCPFGKVEVIQDASLAREPRVCPCLYLDCTTTDVQVIEDAHKFIDGFSALQEAISSVYGFEMDERVIVKNMYEAFQYAEVCTDCIERIGVEIALTTYYYNPVGMGLALACKKTCIPLVDYQHGKQGKYHGMYSHMTHAPEQGYAMLPDCFWTWGEESRDNIQKWLPENSAIKVVVGGNVHMARWKAGLDAEDAPSGKALDEYVCDRQVVVMSMQKIEDPLPESLMRAIKESPDSWLWLLRCHPLHTELYSPMLDALEARYPSKVEWRLASSVNLFSLLERADHHVTCWSSVCYEALSFGIKTTLIKPVGKKLYEEYVQQGLFDYAESGKKMLERIQAGFHGVKQSEQTPYIVTDLPLAEETICSILSS